MQHKPIAERVVDKELGITQLFLSLFSHSLKGIQGKFAYGTLRERNSPSIPLTTNLSTDLVGVSWRIR